MSVELSVDVDSAVPVYEQIRAQVASAIRTGALSVDERLPTIRVLAADLGIAVNTVARAYAELDADGLIKRRRRAGTVIRAQPAGPDLGPVRQQVRDLVAKIRADGVDPETLIALVREAVSERAVEPAVEPSSVSDAAGRAVRRQSRPSAPQRSGPRLS